MSILILRRAEPEADPESGLLFPGFTESGVSTRFAFDTGFSYPATYIWKCRPDTQSTFFSTFFWGLADGNLPVAYNYYGAHPYPMGGGVFRWEVAAGGADYTGSETNLGTTDDNGNDTTVSFGSFYTQALRVIHTGGTGIQFKYYYNLGLNANRVITVTFSNYTSEGPGPNRLTWGDAPWNEGDEVYKGVIRGIQIYDADLTLAQIQARMDLTSNAAVVSADPGSLWYVNLNPTHTDVSDKSGAGHNPTWANSNRPTTWTP